MTSAAWATASLELNPATDIMDIHSDRGVEMDNIDVDIDFDLPRSPAAYKDDVSLKDAVLDAEVDGQTASADQDDFMIDNEDLIDEDNITYDDDTVIEDQQAANETGVEQQQTTPVDDDLIDYSDDEEEVTANDNSDSKASDPATALTSAAAGVVSPTPDEMSTAIESTAVDIADKHEESRNGGLEFSADTGRSWQKEEEAPQEEPHTADHEHSSVPESQQGASSLANPQLSAEQQGENQRTTSDGEVQKQNDPEDANPAAHVSPSPSEQEIELHPITINCSGAELWLFKHHDYEDSGDYLIEDTSITNKPISSVLEACRSALGSDVTNDIELGFRLDNFHNIELYQDHSSCAFITLEQIVGMYLQLHAQDGTSDPESFYMTLLSRPRVSALLNALNEAAAEGIGHVGLEKAITAGLTAFNARLLHNATVNSYDWENEEQQQEHDTNVINDRRDEEGHGQGEYQAHNGYEEEEQFEDQSEIQGGDSREPESVEQINGLDSQDQNSTVVDDALPEPGNVTLNVTDDDDKQPTPVNATLEADKQAGNNVQKTPSQQAEDDYVDYSDDDDDDQVNTEHAAHHRSSTGSTVQGDDTFPVQKVGQDTVQVHPVPAGHDENLSNEYQEVEDDEEDYAQYADVDTGFDAQAYEEYDEQYDGAHDQEHRENQDAQEAFTSQYYEEENVTNNYNFGSEEQAAGHDQDVTTGVDGTYDGQLTVAGGGSIGGEELQNFDFVDETADVTSYEIADGNAQDEYSYNDENSGDSQARVAAASTDVDPVVTLSSESLNSSPQGQKRTIDEVGNDVGEATDPSDAKRPRV